MAILEEIKKMRNEGIGDTEIVGNLQQRGISPKEINDALSQEKIKSAVSGDETREMQPSIMEQTASAPNPQEPPSPQNQDMYAPQEEMYSPQTQEMSQQEYYPEDAGYQSGGMDTTTIIEIAEQVFSEKIKKIKKQMDEMNEFKTLAQMKIENSVERLKRIESTIDKLQSSVLDKVGSYGQNLQSIKKEMSMMQNSFGKMINPIAQRAERQVSHQSLPHPKTTLHHKTVPHHKTSISKRKKISKKR